MSLDTTLKALFDLIRDEAKRNADFRDRLQSALETQGLPRRSTPSLSAGEPSDKKRGNRRPPALFDPIAESNHGETHLREKLASLSLEQLRDIIADFRMDPSKLVMKWKGPERVVEHIVTTALNRRQKGDAFRA
jgi:hypothetical protein